MLNFLQKIGTPRIRFTVQLAQRAAFSDYVPRAVVKRKPKIKGVDVSMNIIYIKKTLAYIILVIIRRALQLLIW